MGEKIKPLSKKDVPLAFILAGTVAGVLAIKEVLSYLKEKADVKKKADLAKLEEDVLALDGPAALEELGRELADGKIHKEIEDLGEKMPEGPKKDAVKAIAQMTRPRPTRFGRERRAK